MRVLLSWPFCGDEPSASHAQVGEEVRLIAEDEVEHLPLASGRGDGEVLEIELSVEDVLREFFGCREGHHFKGEDAGELRTDGFDFG